MIISPTHTLHTTYTYTYQPHISRAYNKSLRNKNKLIYYDYVLRNKNNY